MNIRVTLAVMLLPMVGACNRAAEPTEPEPAQATPAASVAAPARKVYGAPLTPGRPTESLAAVLKQPEAFADRAILVEGDVRSACTRKGCWMELSDGEQGATPGCRVTFKDYGFFVPVDSAGSRARVEARVESKVLAPATVTHMEEEGATFASKEADGSAREVRLVATGVEMWR